MKKNKIIIDTDPGVDDTTALFFALTNDSLDIKLITTVSGNISVTNATRNVCFLLDILNKDIPVVKGSARPLVRSVKHATFLHGVQGLGDFEPPKTTKHKPIKSDAIDKMYEVIKENPNEITIFVFGPHTNVAKLISTYPSVVPLIKKIVFMGGSPYGMKDFPNHDSFNIKCDPEAFEIVLNSGIPLRMLPSHIGRYRVGLDQKEVKQIAKLNSVGHFLSVTYKDYLEPNMLAQGLHVVATNDTSALFCFLYPKIFTIKKANIAVDTKENVGRTFADFCKKGKVEIVVDVQQKEFKKIFFESLKKLDDYKV